MVRCGSSALWRYGLSVVLPILLIALPAAVPGSESKCAYVILLMALWWIMEPIPLAVTALLPVVLYPILGILPTSETTTPYMKESIMMFLGGLMMAVAVEHSNLHHRIALRVVLFLGTSLRRLMLGVMLTTMFLSMWISNTATTAMMVPIVEAVLEEIDLTSDKSYSALEAAGKKEKERGSKRIKHGLFLSVAYAANCGGTGTLTGTGPNLVLKGMFEELYPESNDITFGTWMMYNIPGMLICVLAAYIFLQLYFIGICRSSSEEDDSNAIIKRLIKKRYKELGPMTFQQYLVVILFFLLLLLWLFLDPKFVPGWATYLTDEVQIKDATPAVAVAILLFLLPADPKNLVNGPRLLSWEVVHKKMPWGIILLIGGGFSMAEGAKRSGLSKWFGYQMTSLGVLPPEAILFILCVLAAMFTEVVSNTATANVFLPVINEMARPLQVNPLFMTLPVTVVCSFAFMLPAATPPNAIIFSAAKMKIWDMAKPGIVMNFLCILIQFAMINTLGVAMFDLRTFPSWANTTLHS